MSVICCLIILLCAVGLPAHSSDDTSTASWILKTRVGAVDAALRLTGFSSLKGYSLDSSAVQLVILDDDQTPWLHNQINGKQLWQVQIDVNLELLVENQAGDTLRRFDQNIREFNVYLDPEIGVVIKMSSDPGEYPHRPFNPPADVAEWVLRYQKEIFHGFPNEPPGIDFLEALRSVVGDPFSAKEIHVLYILWSKNNSEPRPVWSIDLRGLDTPAIMPSHSAEGTDIPIEQLNHRRSIVCARTGYNLYSTDAPQSVIPKMYKPSDSSNNKPE
jgi:hypothetical protein